MNKTIYLKRGQRRVPKSWRCLINAEPGTNMGGQWTLDGRFIKRKADRRASRWQRSSSPKKAVFQSKKMWRDA
jgi:hypothetical protein